MTRRRGSAALTFVALAACAAALIPSGASTADADVAAADIVRVRDLDRGPAAKVHWLGGNVIHTASGRRITTPWTARAARRGHLRLIGRTDEGWLLKTFDGGDTWDVWQVKGRERTHVSESSVFEGLVLSHGVSDDGALFYTQTWDEVGDDVIDIEDLSGGEVAGHSFAGDPEVLSFSGAVAVVGTDDTQVWDVATDTVTPLGVDAAGASIVHDLLFVTDDTGESGPTSLSTPGTPPWTADMTAVRVSPDGGSVLSSPSEDDNVVEIRDLETGELVQSYDVRWPASQAVWESGRSIVFLAVTRGDEEALVRCRFSGRCVRVSAIVPDDTITLPRVRESAG